MADDKKKSGDKDKKKGLDASGPLHVRIAKVFLERLAGAGGKAVAGNSYVQAAIDAIKAPIDKAIGAGSADAIFGSELFKAGAAGAIQLPGTFLRPMLARLLRVDESIADDIVQEGVDHAILSFLDETGSAAKGKNPAEQKVIIDTNADKLVEKVTSLARANNREGLKPVWYDSVSGLAHKPKCDVIKGDDDHIIRKDDAGNDFTLLAAISLGGRMTTECACVGILTDPAGTLDAALMRLDDDRRREFDAYLASMSDIRDELLSKGSLAKDVTVAKIRLVLKTEDPAMKKKRLLLLVRMDGSKPVKSPLERATDYVQHGLDVLTDKGKRAKLNMDAKAATAGHRTVRRALGRLIENK
ncbi:hypothetical protein K8R04_03970 [Candidatus Uhrbacteria bacterium]|nr:hypothetical protein [Candidatus Uhrbacteria bacterium]